MRVGVTENEAGVPVARAKARAGRGAWHVLALLVFGLATVTFFRPVWQSGIGSFAPATPSTTSSWRALIDADTTWVAWLVARHAKTLLREPTRLFDTEHCAPAERTLTLGEPLLTQAVLAVPAKLLGCGDTLAYNASLHLQRMLHASAMYVLVFEWTLQPAAGIAAGLFYAFHPVWARDITHPYIYDTGWCVLALIFARRLFARWRWRDAVGLGLAGGLQLGTSLYPVVGSLLLLLPFGVWLAFQHGLRRARLAQLVLVVGITTLFASIVYGPFLASRAAGDGLLESAMQRFTSASSFGATGVLFAGYPLAGLATLGLLARRRAVLAGISGDPRLALLAGGLLVALAACGPNLAAQGPVPLPNVYGWLAALLPGLDAVRVPARVAAGVHVPLCILAGLGAAAALRSTSAILPAAGRRAWLPGLAGGLLIAFVALLMLRPAAVGLRAGGGHHPVDLRPEPEALAFFEELEQLGNTGPLLELPIEGRGAAPIHMARRIRLSGVHGRRTSACYSSFPPAEYPVLENLVSRLPDHASLAQLSELGFTTIVVHNPRRRASAQAMKLGRESRRKDRRLVRVLATPGRTAYAIVPPPDSAEPAGQAATRSADASGRSDAIPGAGGA